MENYDRDAVMGLIAKELEEREFGVQSALARQLRVSTATINKWKKRQTCPSRKYWRGIERFFDWPENRIAKAAGLKPAAAGDVELAIRRDPYIDGTVKDFLISVYSQAKTAQVN